VLSLDTARQNLTANLPGNRAQPGEDKNHPNQRKRHCTVWMTALKGKHKMGVTELRAVKQANIIFLYLAKCPTTGCNCCPEELLAESGKVRHEANRKHNFPSFHSSSEFILQASHPGGLVAAGSQPNHQSVVLFVTIKEAPTDTLGLENTICFGKVNQKVLTSDQKVAHARKIGQGIASIVQDGHDGGATKVET
jgi:hypothetical protein